MRAALLRAPGSLVIEDVATPRCPEGGILVKVDACSICSTDIKMSKVGHRDLIYPRILGHEVVGMIESSDSRTNDLLPGTRVQIWPGIACGNCPCCRRGYDNQCSSIGILGFNRDGGFAEFLAVPKESIMQGGVIPVPDILDSATASLTEPLACCVNAQGLADVRRGDSVLVIGAGPLGAMHAILAKHRGAMVLVAEQDRERCQTIRRAGPDKVIDIGSLDLKESIEEFTGYSA